MINDPIQFSLDNPVYNDGINNLYFIHVLPHNNSLEYFEHLRLMTDTSSCGRAIDLIPEENILFSIVKDKFDQNSPHFYWFRFSDENSTESRGLHESCSVSRFLEKVQDLYPDHFEWFLFHPEWLK